MMKKINVVTLKFLIILIFSGGFQGFAQHPYLFEDYGKSLFYSLADTNATQDPEYIRTRVHRELIDQQTWKNNIKEARKIEMEEAYEEDYNRAMSSLFKLKTEYNQAVKEGAKIEYLSTKFKPRQSEYEQVYEVTTRLYYHSESVQTMVTWRYDVAYLDNFLVLFSPIKENF